MPTASLSFFFETSSVFPERQLQNFLFVISFILQPFFKYSIKKLFLKNRPKIFERETFKRKKTPAVNPVEVWQAVDE